MSHMRQEIIKSGLTNQQLSYAAAVPLASITRMARGGNITADTADRLMRVLQLEVTPKAAPVSAQLVN